jgi:hypothetical protein
MSPIIISPNLSGGEGNEKRDQDAQRWQHTWGDSLECARSLAHRQNSDDTINRCDDQSGEAKNQQRHPHDGRSSRLPSHTQKENAGSPTAEQEKTGFISLVRVRSSPGKVKLFVLRRVGADKFWGGGGLDFEVEVVSSREKDRYWDDH